MMHEHGEQEGDRFASFGHFDSVHDAVEEARHRASTTTSIGGVNRRRSLNQQERDAYVNGVQQGYMEAERETQRNLRALKWS